MKPSTESKHQIGSMLIEMIVAITIIGTLLMLIITQVSQLPVHQNNNYHQTQANLLGQEGIEITYNILHTSNWNLIQPGTYYLEKNGSNWELNPDLPGEIINQDFTRTVIIKSIWRDGIGASIPDPGDGTPPDPNSKNITVNILWTSPNIPEPQTLELQQTIFNPNLFAATKPTPTPTIISAYPPGLQVLYIFNDSGSTINDLADGLYPLDLKLNTPLPSWGSDYLEITDPSIIDAKTDNAAQAYTKIYNACTNTQQLTMEAWVSPANDTQNGPATILSMSDPNNFNASDFSIAQDGSRIYTQLNTDHSSSQTNQYTTNSVVSPDNPLQIVYTWDGTQTNGNSKIYINGIEDIPARKSTLGTLNWNQSYQLTLANHPTSTHAWQGKLHRVAVYCSILTANEIIDNYNQGPEDNGDIPIPPPSTPTPIPSCEFPDAASPWTSIPIGNATLSGAGRTQPQVSVCGAGKEGFENNTLKDEGQYMYQYIGQNQFEFTAKLTSFNTENPAAHTGIMLRSNPNTNTSHYFAIFTDKENQIYASWRDASTNNRSAQSRYYNITANPWIKITRDNNLFKAYYRTSTTQTWKAICEANNNCDYTINLPQSITYGFASSSKEQNKFATATYTADVDFITALQAYPTPTPIPPKICSAPNNPGPWQLDPINTAPLGTINQINSNHVQICGYGENWGGKNSYQLILQNSSTPNLELTTKVNNITPNDPNQSQYGLYLRLQNNSNSTGVGIAVSANGRIMLKNRDKNSQTIQSAPITEIPGSPPIWLKILKHNDDVAYFYSLNGQDGTWLHISTENLPFGSNYQYGFGIASGKYDDYTIGHFESFQANPNPDIGSLLPSPSPTPTPSVIQYY